MCVCVCVCICIYIYIYIYIYGWRAVQHVFQPTATFGGSGKQAIIYVYMYICIYRVNPRQGKSYRLFASAMRTKSVHVKQSQSSNMYTLRRHGWRAVVAQ